jgi:hypothetical protein
LSDAEREKLRTALHALVEKISAKTPACGSGGWRGSRPTLERGSSPAALLRWQQRKIALFFTGRQHAGENLADVLAQRVDLLHAPIQMCDALSRNTPKLTCGLRILLANCLSHGRRQFVASQRAFRGSADSCWKRSE